MIANCVGPLCAAVSTGLRNTLIFQQRWSVSHGQSPPHIFHR
jgi:hypothetical protein